MTNRFSVCVCIAFVPFQWEITEIECLSCFGDFFVRFHIVCDRYTSDYDQITFSDTIWPLLLSPDFGTQMITLAETASYAKYSNFYLFSCRLCLTKWANHKCVERTDIYWDKNLKKKKNRGPLTCRHNITWARSENFL